MARSGYAKVGIDDAAKPTLSPAQIGSPRSAAGSESSHSDDDQGGQNPPFPPLSQNIFSSRALV
jgi:hypothetical protein